MIYSTANRLMICDSLCFFYMKQQKSSYIHTNIDKIFYKKQKEVENTMVLLAIWTIGIACPPIWKFLSQIASKAFSYFFHCIKWRE